MQDVTILDHGSIVLLRPETPAALAWVAAHIGEDNAYQPWFPTVLCERRYVADILEGMTAAGLTAGRE